MVPLEKAREIVTVADRSARAQYCDLPEEQSANFQSMMRGSSRPSKWTKQQLRVHHPAAPATTVAYLTGTHAGLFQGEGEAGPEVVTKGPVMDRALHGQGARGHQVARSRPTSSEAPAIPAAKDATPATPRAEPVFGHARRNSLAGRPPRAH